MNMENQKEILREIETDLQQMNTKEIPVVEKTEALVEDHHSKKHIGIIILLTVLLVAILIVIAIVFRPSQAPEDVLNRLENVSAPVTQTEEEVAQELTNLAEQGKEFSWDTLSEERRLTKEQEILNELSILGNQ